MGNSIVTKTLTFYETEGKPYISLCAEDGRHYLIELSVESCALLNREVARFVSYRIVDQREGK